MAQGTRMIQVAGSVVACLALCVATSCLTACSADEAYGTPVAVSEAPATANPEEPTEALVAAGWRVVSDPEFSAADIAPLSRKLGIEIRSLKNTDYEVNGKAVKVNTMTTSDAAAATALLDKIKEGGKPKEFLVQRGRHIYEFVCKNDAIPEAREGVRLLSAK